MANTDISELAELAARVDKAVERLANFGVTDDATATVGRKALARLHGIALRLHDALETIQVAAARCRDLEAALYLRLVAWDGDMEMGPWRCSLVDMKALARAVVDGRIDPAVLAVDWRTIEALAPAPGNRPPDVPGLRFYRVTSDG